MTLVKMLDDVYPHGCLGDVVGLNADALKELDAVAKVRKHLVYVPVSFGASAEPDASEDAPATGPRRRTRSQAAPAEAPAEAEEAPAAEDAQTPDASEDAPSSEAKEQEK